MSADDHRCHHCERVRRLKRRRIKHRAAARRSCREARAVAAATRIPVPGVPLVTSRAGTGRQVHDIDVSIKAGMCPDVESPRVVVRRPAQAAIRPVGSIVTRLAATRLARQRPAPAGSPSAWSNAMRRPSWLMSPRAVAVRSTRPSTQRADFPDRAARADSLAAACSRSACSNRAPTAAAYDRRGRGSVAALRRRPHADPDLTRAVDHRHEGDHLAVGRHRRRPPSVLRRRSSR